MPTGPENGVTRREFVSTAAGAAVGTVLAASTPLRAQAKRRYAIVGTGVRGIGMWGTPIARRYADAVEFVGLSDINPIRLETAKKSMGVSCPTFTNFDEMMDKAKPDLLMVTTVDGFHSEYIVKALPEERRRSAVYAVAGVARRRHVVPDRHRRAQELRRGKSDPDRRSRQDSVVARRVTVRPQVGDAPAPLFWPAAALAGSTSSKRAPQPTPALCARSVPPCSVATELAIARPRPRPPSEPFPWR